MAGQSKEKCMPKFTYKVRDSLGRTETGALTASDLLEASRGFRSDGKIIVSLRPEPVTGGRPSRKKVGRDDVIYFATQLAVMVDTGVPLAEALDAIAAPGDHPAMQEIVSDLAQQVKSGREFSAALEKHPKIFNQLFVALMRASEASGTMGQMLVRLSEYMERERETRKRVKGALTYPVCMLTFCVLVVAGMLIFILPRFEKIYAGKGAVLPTPTRLLLAASRTLVDHWPVMLGALAACGVGGWLYLRSPSGKILLDRIRISVPVLGRMYRKSYLARSLRTMATMISTGVSMLDGLTITAQVAGNYYYQKIWMDLAEGVKKGQALSDQLSRHKLIPRTVWQMIAAGERSGRLAMVMNRVAGFCEDELKISVKAATSMVEPLMIVIMGLIVGGIAMALLLPVFSISKVIAR